MVLPPRVREAVVEHALLCRPHEACGLLAMDAVGRIRMAYPLTNADASPDRFTIAPEEQFGALTHAENSGWVIGGVFHSHPRGPAVPSAIDLAQPHDPEWIHVLVGFSPRLEVRTWSFNRGEADEIGIA